MIHGIIRSSTFALHNVVRNLWLSVVTVFLMILTILSMLMVLEVNTVGSKIIEAIQSKVDINIFFEDAAKEKDILAAQAYLEQLPGVRDVVYVSQDDAEAWLRERYAHDPNILSALDEVVDKNVLPSSLVVRAYDIANYAKILSTFQTSQFENIVAKADYDDNQDIIISLSHRIQQASRIGIGISAVFVIISIIVIFNLIRLAIYSHREEIMIMRLVGATDWFIRSPFVMESMLLGVGAAVCALAIFFGILSFADPSVRDFFSGFDFSIVEHFRGYVWQFIFGTIFGAVILSCTSTMIAVTRYLKK